jgi:tetratricopeptide (TPR) repeat protein
MNAAATPAIARLEKLLGTPRDGALLRFSLGLEYAKAGNAEKAIEHLRQALATDPAYSAAWRALGKALESAGQADEALAAYRDGIAAAQRKGDKQAEKEMTVFARRLEKQARARAPAADD